MPLLTNNGVQEVGCVANKPQKQYLSAILWYSASMLKREIVDFLLEDHEKIVTK